jgi:hypothetical protein
MKKVSILLLLTVVLASFAFAIEGVGDFTGSLDLGFDNVGGGNEGALGVTIEPAIKFSRSFGGFGISAKLGDVVRIPTDEEKNGTDKIGDDLYFNVTPSYSLAAGPGTLGLALGIQLNVPITDEGWGLANEYLEGEDAKYKNIFFRIDPSVSYDLDAGFGALAFSLGTDHIQISKYHANDDGDQEYGLDRLKIYFQAGVDLPFGLGLWIKPVLGLQMDDDVDDDDTGLDNFDFDIHYAINEQITAGVETSIPTVEDGIKNSGIDITPYANFSFGALGAYAKVGISKVATDTDPSTDVQIKPMVGVSYKF